MGTNYYVKENCIHCKKSEEIHLGKSSGGWKFSFQYNDGQYYKNITEMKKWLKGKKIFDEYGKRCSQKDFWSLVKAKQHEVLSHAEEYPSESDFIINGYSFTNCWFS
jgi:hypothetical protein